MSRLNLHRKHLIQNINWIKKELFPGGRLQAMVKANAYGHGIKQLAPLIEPLVDCFGVAYLEEGLELRPFLKKPIPISVFSGDKNHTPETIELMVQNQLRPVISSLQEWKNFSSLLKTLNTNEPISIELKFDSGMNRLGVYFKNWDQIYSEVLTEKRVKLVGIHTHFSSADSDWKETLKQDDCFQSWLKKNQIKLDHLANCNSAALLQMAQGKKLGSNTNQVRPGLMLYGAAPSFDLQQKFSSQLQPVANWETRVIEIKTPELNAPIGYNQSAKWSREYLDSGQKLALIPIGYADGYNRLLSNQGEVLIRGKRFPVIGRVSMDLTAIVVSPQVEVGDPVVLMGNQQGELGSDTIHPWELAKKCDTIPYEIWTGIGGRVERQVV